MSFTIRSQCSDKKDLWPWSCLRRRFSNNDTLKEFISRTGCSDIYDAAVAGYVGFVQFYAENDPFGNWTTSGRPSDGKSPLYLALENGRWNVVDYIDDRTVQRKFKETVYSYLASKLSYDTRTMPLTPLADILFNFEKYSYPTPVKNATGYLTMESIWTFMFGNETNLLHLSVAAGNLDLLEYLVEKRRDHVTSFFLDQYSTVGSPLHFAAYAGNLKAVRFLVERLNFSVNARSHLADRATPSHKAAQGDNLSVLRYLVDEKGADLDPRDSEGNSALHYAAFYGQLEVVKYLVEEKRVKLELRNDNDMTALHCAVAAGKLDVVKYLVGEKKADLFAKFSIGHIRRIGVLHMASYGGRASVLSYLIKDMNMIPFINDMTIAGSPPLSYRFRPPFDLVNFNPMQLAVIMDRISAIEFLLDQKHADPNVLTERGENLLHIAAELARQRIAQYLVEQKCFSTKWRTFAGKTALDLASELHREFKNLTAKTVLPADAWGYVIPPEFEPMIKYLTEVNDKVFCEMYPRRRWS